jgi:hypothetical protein
MHPLGKFCDPVCQKESFPDIGVLTTYDKIEAIYLPQRCNIFVYTLYIRVCPMKYKGPHKHRHILEICDSMGQNPFWEVNIYSDNQDLFPFIYATERFITVVTRSATDIHSDLEKSSSHTDFLLSCHLYLRLASTLFPSGFQTKIIYSILISPFYVAAFVWNLCHIWEHG